MKLVELIMYKRCNKCNECGANCDFYKEFEKNCIPELDINNNKKCKYSYELKKVIK